MRSNSKKLFGYADVGRYGLAHGILAWARCVVWCHKTNSEMIASHWFHFRIGPYLRKERDKREYFKLFNNRGMIKEPLRTWHFLTAKIIRSTDGFFNEDIYQSNKKKQKSIYIFTNSLADNEKKHFHEIISSSAIVKKKLIEITKNKYLPKDKNFSNIAIHIRLGDFLEDKNLNKNNTRLPIAWYIAILKRIRQQTEYNIPAIVYSDGSDEELRDILAQPFVKRSKASAAITDLLCISESLLLIASGSGFSRLGAFLGQVPTIFYPNKNTCSILENKTLEIENDGHSLLPNYFIEAIKLRLQDTQSNDKKCI